jgi:hypothetical protein
MSITNRRAHFGIHDYARDSTRVTNQTKALSPVMDLPTISVFISLVPSYE